MDRQERKALWIAKATAHFDTPEIRKEASEMFEKANPIKLDEVLDSLLKEVEGKTEEIGDKLYDWDAYPASDKQAKQVVEIFSQLIKEYKDKIKG